MSGLHVDWASLALVTVVTVTVTALVILIVSLAARMLGEVRLKREAGRAQGLHAAEVAAGFFLALTAGIAVRAVAHRALLPLTRPAEDRPAIEPRERPGPC